MNSVIGSLIPRCQEFGKFHLFTRDLEPEFVTPKFQLKVPRRNLQFPLLWHQTRKLIISFIKFWLLPKFRLQILHPNTPCPYILEMFSFWFLCFITFHFSLWFLDTCLFESLARYFPYYYYYFLNLLINIACLKN